MALGHLALLLHAHLPYVRHPEYDEFLEEDWLFEAIVETYVPLLEVLERLADEGVPFKLTLTMTPTLCAMLRDPLLQRRAQRYIERAVELSAHEIERTRDQPQFHELARFYHERFSRCRALFVERWKCDVVTPLAALQEHGMVEIITCAATHGFLPLMEPFPEAVRAQICIGRDHYRETFGRDPAGIWLPECAYVHGLDSILQEANLRWFVLDAHGLMFGNPRPLFAIYAPCFTSAGPAACARDRESSRQVWSAEEGYPGDPAYRDFYRDIGFDLSHNYLRPYLPPDGTRKFTGIKYHRITGRAHDKDVYNRGWAMGAVDWHAGDFMQSRVRQFEQLIAAAPDFEPMIVSPFDAELFGHWWFEGPEFLNLFIRKAVFDQRVFQFTTPSRYLGEHPTLQIVEPTASSWGHKGYWEVWLDESNHWIYPHLHMAARRMTEVAREFAHGRLVPPERRADCEMIERALKQMARELLLAQSSDWAFLMKTGTARTYASKRTKDHILRFTRLHDQVRTVNIDVEFLANCEWRDNLFPNLNWRYYV